MNAALLLNKNNGEKIEKFIKNKLKPKSLYLFKKFISKVKIINIKAKSDPLCSSYQSNFQRN